MSFLILFICGILSALPYLNGYLFFFPYFSFAPLYLIAKRKKSAYRHGLCFSMGYFLVVYHWFIRLYPLDFAGFDKAGSLAVVAIAWFGMAIMQSIGSAFVPFIFRRITKGRSELFSPFAFASLWVIAEWAQNFFWFGVPWARLAIGQHKILPIVQSASLIGSLGVSFIIVLISGFAAMAYDGFVTKRSVKMPIITAAAVFLCNFIFGTAVLFAPKNEKNTFTAAAIQGNIASSDKWADDSVNAALSTYIPLTEKAVKENGASLVVWPETVLICDLNLEDELKAELCSLSDGLDIYLALGAFYSDGGEDYNSIYLFTPDGKLSETIYSKRHLVPFGEYLPIPDVINAIVPILADMNLFSNPLIPGKDSELFDTDLGRIGALVCFDSIYEGLTLDSVRDGAELIVLSTNDSWYEDSAAVYQHNGHAVLRAIESGRSVVRAANTGISTIIDENGRIKDSLPPLVSGIAVSDVSASSRRTVYSLIGNLIVVLCIIYVVSLLIYKIFEVSKKYCQNKRNVI